MIEGDGLADIPHETIDISQFFEQERMSVQVFSCFDQLQRAAQVLDRVVVGKESHRLMGGFAIILDSFLAFVGKREVICQQAIQPVQAVGIDGFHDFAHTSMERTAAFDQDGFVHRLLCERVAKGILDLGNTRRFADQVHPQQRTQMLIQLVTGFVNCLEHTMIKGASDHRGKLQRAAGRFFEAVHARREQGL